MHTAINWANVKLFYGLAGIEGRNKENKEGKKQNKTIAKSLCPQQAFFGPKTHLFKNGGSKLSSLIGLFQGPALSSQIGIAESQCRCTLPQLSPHAVPVQCARQQMQCAMICVYWRRKAGATAPRRGFVKVPLPLASCHLFSEMKGDEFLNFGQTTAD